ncbi:MAG: SH3 domain-containing protein [Oscillospiraceae bacterium]|jgi:mannosyl-glycoprotein endo-beta-N-acetylglucosaminidase|nr:SH3 domain-containing protein [Oscillospiraceae bacterium]
MYRKTIAILVLSVMLCGCAFAASVGDIMYVAPPSGYNLNLRAAPSYDATIIASYKAGTEVVVMQDLGEFKKVSVGFVVGYMASEYLSQGKSSSGSSGGTSGGAIGTAYVNNPKAGQRLNLRAKPSTQAEVLGSFLSGTSVVVYENLGGWLSVSINGIRGYVMAKYISFGAAGSAQTNTSAGTLTVYNPNGGNFVNQRSGAGYDYRILQRVATGTRVTKQAAQGEWIKITVNGVTGWMNALFLR